MDRVTIYPGAIPLETDLLATNKNAMVAIAKLSAAMFGTSTIANGLAVTPTSPASLQVQVAAGEVYSLQNVDGTAYSSIAADTAHQIMKQGISLDTVTLSCAAPTTSGQSINYLVQATYQDTDATPVVLPYYNATNPSQAYSGPNNTGVAQYTARNGVVVLSAKAGVSATTGSQTTPAPDAGYVGLYVVTVAYAQTTITATSIARYAAAPLLPAGLVQSVQNGTLTYATGTGAANAYTASYAPAITTLTDGLTLHSTAIAANTGASTFSPNGLTAKPIVSLGQAALIGGELVVNGRFSVRYSATLDSWVLLSASGGSALSGRLINIQVFTGTGVYTPTAGTNFVIVEVVGGGGGSGGCVATSASQYSASGGGASGSFARGRVSSGFAGVTVTVGSGGTAGAAGGDGGAGGASSFGAVISAPGGTGSVAGTALTTSGAIVIGASPGAISSGASIFNTRGTRGGQGFTASLGGDGGSCPYGSGGLGSGNTGVSGSVATGYGSGAGGNCRTVSQAAISGFAGQAGLVIVSEYA